jgi:hypothetical protein
VTPPEAALTAESTAILPPKAKPPIIEQPPVHAGLTPVDPAATVPVQAAANDAKIKTPEEKKIEAYLADFIFREFKHSPDMVAGLNVDVTLRKSNDVTAHNSESKNVHDLLITFEGGKFENPEMAQKLAEQLRAAMREHPAFKSMSFGGVDTKIEHQMDCQILALEPEHLQELLKLQPHREKTPIAPIKSFADMAMAAAPTATELAAAHECKGAACAHCAPEKAPAAAEAAAPVATPEAARAPAPKPESDVAPAATPVAAPAAAPAAAATVAPAAEVAQAPAVEQPKAEAPPADLPASPVTTVANPAAHKGMAVANDQRAALSA